MATKPSVDDTLNYEKLIDMKISVLEELVKDCETAIEETRADIVQNYENAKPFLMKMRVSKTRLRQLVEKTEAYKAFLSTGKDGSLVSHLDIASLRKNFPEMSTSSPNVSLPPTPKQSPPPIRRNLSKTVVKAPKTPPMKSKPKSTVMVRDKFGKLVLKKRT